MYIKDLDPYCYDLGGRVVRNTACVGWLEHVVPPPIEKSPSRESELGKTLLELGRRWAVNRYRGTHYCTICPVPADEFILREDGEKPLLLGAAELWIPSADRKIVFVAPDLVFHYLVDHGYVPPADFVLAVSHVFETYMIWDPFIESKRMINAVYEQRHEV